jgi:hypothetical protein
MGKVRDSKTLVRIRQALGGEVIAKLHRWLVEIAQEKGVIRGRKMQPPKAGCDDHEKIACDDCCGMIPDEGQALLLRIGMPYGPGLPVPGDSPG